MWPEDSTLNGKDKITKFCFFPGGGEEFGVGTRLGMSGKKEVGSVGGNDGRCLGRRVLHFNWKSLSERKTQRGGLQKIGRQITVPWEQSLLGWVGQVLNCCLYRKVLEFGGSSNIKERVEDMVDGLHDLTEVEQKDVLSSLMHCLSKDGHLEDLQERVSEALISGELQMESSSGLLLSTLFNTAGILLKARDETILDLLDALIELSEEKQFVVEALEKGTLPQLKDQVRQPGLRTKVIVEERVP
ncbi:gasdermin-B isoform X3 [Nycticebus coucang]|uniref:gasdermin-B isoform X3 n=1 Tax=Nycticebus coucang TaxID=9470 RepID=UPI00234C5212|nr:gasdermin-B isoform X3 [Nycticebus coucang]